MNIITSQVVLPRPRLRLLTTHWRKWQRAGAAVWRALQAVGHRRAERELLLLLEQWEITRPELAKEIRASLRRGD